MTRTAPSLTTLEKRRPKIGGILYTAFLAAIVFTSFRNSARTEAFAVGVVVVPAVLFVGYLVFVVPALIRAKQWSAYSSNYRPFDPAAADLAPALAARIQRAVDELAPLGFVPVGSYSLTGQVPNGVQGYVTLFENPKTFDTARFNFVSAPAVITSSLSFMTEYSDGSIYWTSNNRLPIITPRDDSHPASLSFPQVEDSGRLYEIHRARINYGATRSPVGNDPVGYLSRSDRRTKQRWIDKGYYVLDTQADRLRLTWKGAYIVTWLLIWPVPAVRRVLRRNQAARVLREYGLE